MTKYKKASGCTGHAKIIGSHVHVKTVCPVHVKGAKAASGAKSAKAVKSVPRKPATNVPSTCKGLRGKERRKCAKTVCAQRPKEYRAPCLKKAGLR